FNAAASHCARSGTRGALDEAACFAKPTAGVGERGREAAGLGFEALDLRAPLGRALGALLGLAPTPLSFGFGRGLPGLRRLLAGLGRGATALGLLLTLLGRRRARRARRGSRHPSAILRRARPARRARRAAHPWPRPPRARPEAGYGASARRWRRSARAALARRAPAGWWPRASPSASGAPGPRARHPHPRRA